MMRIKPAWLHVLAGLLLCVVVLWGGYTAIADPVPDDPVLGADDAPITIIMYASPTCSYTGDFFKDSLPQLRKDYVETGKVRLIFKFKATSGDQLNGSLAAMCANDQGKFWEYAGVLFENRTAWIANPQALSGFAEDLGLDSARFDECMRTGKHAALIQANFDEANSVKLSSTPSSVINGLRITGNPPWEQYEAQIRKFRD